MDVVVADLSTPVAGDEIARNASYSRVHFQRLFREATGETPGDCRKRLLLERAAHQLRYTAHAVTSIALNCGYESLEGFSRAFKRSFGVSPSHFRRLESPGWLLPAPSDVHYNPVIGAAVRVRRSSALPRAPGGSMDLIDRLIEHDVWMTRRLLDAAGKLTAEQLDQPLRQPMQWVSFEDPDDTLRMILNRLVFGKEVWLSGLHGRPLPEQDESVPGLQRRFAAAANEWLALVRRVRDEGIWDEHFVDLACDPPETFTYGGMIAHVMTIAAQRRGAALQLLHGHGVPDAGWGDPIEYDTQERVR